MIVALALLIGQGVFQRDVKVDWPDLLMASPRAKAVVEPDWLKEPAFPPFDAVLGPFSDADVKPDPAMSDPAAWDQHSPEWLRYQRYLAGRDQSHSYTLQQAKEMIAAENYRDAVDVLRNGMDQFPADTRFADQLADAYLSLGRFEDAYQLLVYRVKAESKDSGAPSTLLGDVSFLDRLSAASGALGEVYPGQGAFLRKQILAQSGSMSRDPADLVPDGYLPKDVEFLALLDCSFRLSAPNEAGFDHSLAEQARKLEPKNPLAFYASLRDGMDFHQPPTTGGYAHILQQMTSTKAMQPIYSQSQDEDVRSSLKHFVSTDVHNYIEGAAKKSPAGTTGTP